tara:strand:- start:310 stop:633 length:324 start_codon:yes stop_codon:yes gene_type:complete
MMEIIRQEKIRAAITKINPDSKVLILTDKHGVDKIEWLGDTTPIPQSEIDAKLVELQAEYDSQEYARKRRAEYPNWDKQLEKIYDDGIEAWKAEMIDPIKAKYPKPD